MISTRPKHALFAALCAISAIVLGGCSGPEKVSEHLDVAATPPAPALSSNDEWARRQMMITYQALDADGNVVITFDDDDRWLQGGIDALCQYPNNALVICPPSWVVSEDDDSICGCAADLSLVNYERCRAATLLAASTPQSSPVIVPGVSDVSCSDTRPCSASANGPKCNIPAGHTNGVCEDYPSFRLLPPSDAAAAELAKAAAMASEAAISHGWSLLDQNNPNHPDGACFDNTGNPTSQFPDGVASDVVASGIVDDYHWAKEAYERAIQTNLNAAEAARSSTRSPGDSASRETAYRAAAAHLLVGGEPGLLGSTDVSFCIGPELTPNERSALQLIRDSGVSPVLVASPGVSTSALLDDAFGSGGPDEGSVRQRLAQYYRIPEFADDAGSVSKTVEEQYGLSLNDFEQARSYFNQESAAFARSQVALLPAGPDGGYRAYAGTVGSPSPLPAAAWAARAKYAKDYWLWQGLGNGMASLIASTHAVALELWGAQPLRPPILGSILTDREYRGALEIYFVAGEITANVYGYDASDRVRVVVGEDGLRCALEGTIEGASCPPGPPSAQYPCIDEVTNTVSPPSLACLTAIIPRSALSEKKYGEDKAVEGFRSFPINLVDNKTRYYLVKPKNYSSPELPGSFEALTGFIPIKNSNLSVPIVPSMDNRVPDVLAPSKKFCAVPQTSCAGVRYDSRLPLEDELTDDNNGVESSWQHYLTLARQAATEADLLGKEYLDTHFTIWGDARDTELRKEENRQRAEDALNEVQSYCGTAIDARRLLDLISNHNKLPACQGSDCLKLRGLVRGECPPACASGYTCQAGVCVMDFSAWISAALADPAADPVLKRDPNMLRLQRCLDESESSVVPFLSLGRKSMCVYHDAHDPNIICPSNMSGKCPTSLADDKTCPTDPATGAIGTPTETLGYFESTEPEPPPPNGTGLGPCDTLRKLRHYPSPEGLAALASYGVLHPEFLRDRLKNIAFHAKPAGYVDILDGDAVVYSTGDVVNGPHHGWPCSEGITTWPAGCMGDLSIPDSRSLFCAAAHCENANQKLKMTKRLFQASMAAAWMHRGVFEFKFPTDTTKDYNRYHNSCKDSPSSTDTIYENNSQSRPIHVCIHSERGDQYGFNYTPFPVMWPNWDDNGADFLSGQTQIEFYSTSPSQFPPLGVPDDGNLKARDAFFFGGLTRTYGNTTTPQWAAGVLGDGKPADELFGRAFNYNMWTSGAKDHKNVRVLIPPGQLDGQALMDGLELLCELSQSPPPVQPPATEDQLEQLDGAADAFESAVDSINERASRLIFPNVPRLAMDALQDASVVGTFPSLSGTMAEQVASLRGSLVRVHGALPAVAAASQQMAAQTRNLRAELAKIAATKQLIGMETMNSVMDHAKNCVQATASISVTAPASGGAAAGACALDAMQSLVDFAKQTQQVEIQNQDEAQARAAFAEHVSALIKTIEDSRTDLLEGVQAIGGTLAAIDGLRKNARVALAKALYLNSYESQQQATYTRALGTLAVAEQVRYEQALKNAKLMADLAKRAIEQRIGMRLADMQEDLPLVGAPKTWEGTVCSMSGVNPASVAALARGHETKIAQGYIGDYVTKLENLIESYRLKFPFHEGTDTAVVSLRDDVKDVRASCPVVSKNLFTQAGQLQNGAWRAAGCKPVTVGEDTLTANNCVRATPILIGDSPSSPFPATGNSRDGVDGFELSFAERSLTGATCSATTCGWQPGAALAQDISLVPGRYRISWYTRDSINLTAPISPHGAGRREIVQVTPKGGGAPVQLTSSFTLYGAPTSSTNGIYAVPGSAVWNRLVGEFDIIDPGIYTIGFGSPPGDTVIPDAMTIAAPMLERSIADREVALGSFQNTGDELKVILPVCQDTDGETFRLRSWHRGCEYLCANGFSAGCMGGDAHCFRELTFNVQQPDIQRGKIFNYSGFARGNFNYRIESVGVNFVGDVRDCQNSPVPDTCYNAAFVPYSIQHNGPFYVLNHLGQEYRAYLTDGRIEHARGLAAERYISNPMSSTDRDLISTYLRNEFRGRPLDGEFVVRVWEEPGVDFEAIKDVQLVLNYRYWTRFE